MPSDLPKLYLARHETRLGPTPTSTPAEPTCR